MTQNPEETITIRLSKEEYIKLNKIAMQKGMKIEEIVKAWIIEKLQEIDV